MEAAEVPTQLQAAREALERYDYDEAYTIADAVYESGVATDVQKGDAAFYAGEGAYGLGSMDAAHHLLTEAAGSASADLRGRAQARLQDVQELDTATGAAHEGMTAAEATASLAAGDDAIARGDLDAAEQLFGQVYKAGGMSLDDMGRAGLGLARVYAYRGDHDTADQYAAFAQDPPASKAGATELREWIAHQRAATTATADGVTANEFRQVWEASRDAYTANQFDRAFELAKSVYDSPQAPATLRASFAYNMGMACLRTHDYDAAHQYFTLAQADGDADVQGKCAARFAELARRDGALDLAAGEEHDLAQPALPAQ